jgi:Rod binding domain-containing protein
MWHGRLARVFKGFGKKTHGRAARATDMTQGVARTSSISTHGARAAQSDHDKLVKQAQIWVSQTFFGTLLKQMRQSPFKSELFSGGRGGQAYSELYDQHLADRMARGAGTKLVNSIVRKIEAKAAYRKSGQRDS